MSLRSHRIVAVLALLLVVAAARRGMGQGPGQAGDQEVKARALFAEGRYVEALDVYVKLYAEKPHPTYLRNIGRCYQNLEQPDKAISSFREYLRQSKQLSNEQREQVEGYIREMQELKRRQRDAVGARAPAPAPRLTPATAARATPESLAERRSRPEPQKAETGAGMRPVAIGLGVAGVVGLGVGAWFGLDARSKWADATEQCPMPASGGCSDGSRQIGKSADRSATMSTIGFAAGGVLAAGGVALWFLSRDSSADRGPSASLRFVPQVGAQMAVGTIAGTF